MEGYSQSKLDIPPSLYLKYKNEPWKFSQLITSSFELDLVATILEIFAEVRTIPSCCCCNSDDLMAALDESRLAGVATADPESVIAVAAIDNKEVRLENCSK